MSDKDDSAIHKLATTAANAVKAVEAEIDSVMAEANAELLKGPSHIGGGEPDVFGFMPDEVPVDVIPVFGKQEEAPGLDNDKHPTGKAKSPPR